jgi:two-component system sensor histidine kinase VicK
LGDEHTRQVTAEPHTALDRVPTELNRRTFCANPDTDLVAQMERAALEGIGDAIQLVDSQGRELFANKRMQELRGEIGEELAGLLEVETDPNVRSRVEMELPGSGRVLERYSAPLKNSLGTLMGHVLVLRDLTAERAGERLQDELISIVSHELRTPLVSTLGFANLLLADTELVRETRRSVETIRDETIRVLSIVDNLLHFRRAGDGFSRHPSRFDLADAIEEQVVIFRTTAVSHDVRFERPAEPLVAEADREWITQVLTNLLSNAVKYSPDGGSITISGERMDGRLRISVRDEGIGIPADQRGKVFEKFSRVETPEMRDIKGIGLGLALCREILADHGGTIDFESLPGQGSTFFFELLAA